MKFGVCVPNYGVTGTPAAVKAVALEAERLGYDSIWCTDHILMPQNSGTPYEQILESLTTLAFLASETSRARLGISSLVMPLRNPIIVAKQLATIDNLSNGRIMLATGSGWNETEFSHLGSNFHNRGKRLDESIRLIRELWSGGVKFQSRTLKMSAQNGIFQPAPIQRRLTIWIGGTSDAAMRRAATLGDGWHPNAQPLDSLSKLVMNFRKSSPEADKKEISVRIGLDVKTSSSSYLSAQGEKRILLSSNREENASIIAGLENLGVMHAVLVPSRDGKAPVDQQLEGLRLIARDFL